MHYDIELSQLDMAEVFKNILVNHVVVHYAVYYRHQPSRSETTVL